MDGVFARKRPPGLKTVPLRDYSSPHRGESAPLSRQIRSRLISNEAATSLPALNLNRSDGGFELLRGSPARSLSRRHSASSVRPSEDVLKYQPIKFGWNGGCERA